MNRIKIRNLQRKLKINQQSLKRTAIKTLQHLSVDGAELSILLVDDKIITDLNYLYLNRNSPTDVLAFRMQDGKFKCIHPEILGDVVISLDTAKSRAHALKTSFQYETNLYLVHGILHLLGFKDKARKGRLEMKKMQEEILGTYA